MGIIKRSEESINSERRKALKTPNAYIVGGGLGLLVIVGVLALVIIKRRSRVNMAQGTPPEQQIVEQSTFKVKIHRPKGIQTDCN